jgi:chemotaxis protein methyltransferase CheR
VLREAARAGEPRVWSAACSTGEEPYSVAITAAETFGTSRPPVRILATDIDTAVLETARRGVYRDASVARLDAGVVRRHFRRGAGGSAGAIEVSEGLRERIDFRRLNLLDAAWPVQERFDAIFCRNVLIYFDRAGQRAILERLAPRLAPGGVLCVGHAENLHWARDLFAPCGRTAYRAARPGSRPRGERPWLR